MYLFQIIWWQRYQKHCVVQANWKRLWIFGKLESCFIVCLPGDLLWQGNSLSRLLLCFQERTCIPHLFLAMRKTKWQIHGMMKIDYSFSKKQFQCFCCDILNVSLSNSWELYTLRQVFTSGMNLPRAIWWTCTISAMVSC